MNLRRQLLLVSLLTLILPWGGCQFIRETESALREGQQQMLAGTAQAIADSLSQFPYEFLKPDPAGALDLQAARDELLGQTRPAATKGCTSTRCNTRRSSTATSTTGPLPMDRSKTCAARMA